MASIALVIGFVVAESNSRLSPEIIAFRDNTLVTVDKAQFEAELETAKGKPVLLLLYASWCPYCKQQIVGLKAVKTLFPEDQLKVIYLSTDANPLAASEFLFHKQQEDQLTPFHLPMDDQTGLKKALVAEYGMKEGDAIPHIAIFDRDHKLASEFVGLSEVGDIVTAIKKLL